jgi:hypothetical protein
MENVVPVVDDPEKQTITDGIGASQGFKGIAIRVGLEVIGRTGDGNDYLGQVITTAWQPDADELERLNAGAAVYISQNTNVVAPILVTVGDGFQEEFDFRTSLNNVP